MQQFDPMASDDIGDLHRAGLDESDCDDDLLLGVAGLDVPVTLEQAAFSPDGSDDLGRAALSDDGDDQPMQRVDPAHSLAIVAGDHRCHTHHLPFDVHDVESVGWSKPLVLSWFGACTLAQHELLGAVLGRSGKCCFDAVKSHEVEQQLDLYPAVVISWVSRY